MGWRPPLHRIARALWNACPKKYRHVYYEKFPFAFEPEAVDSSSPAHYYWGYWQNTAYIEPIAHILRDKLQLRIESASFAQLRNEIAGRSSLSIHVRRYLDFDRNGRVIASAQRNHGVCDASYFERAARVVLERGHNHVYIFSDDPEWVKMNLHLPVPHSYVADFDFFSAAEELMLMAACENHVISNSSFSWWGAWLGKNPQKIVVAPQKWFRNSFNSLDIIPNNWIAL